MLVCDYRRCRDRIVFLEYCHGRVLASISVVVRLSGLVGTRNYDISAADRSAQYIGHGSTQG